ncbi:MULTISPECIES: 30S ribosome-binding factor RbfA [unclassified Adlercreutzia]|uniref:30S ribosome-binding factor RbfA n=1 Tax=unclassified Adlercreutzia TaxID=2636013 RepID=UPI001F151D42|nr:MULTISPECIES: 30S ribosome-binding factor RbfA [unclassified Adlercreutzia]
MKEGNRKVDERAREVISNIMLFDISDPRLQMVTITGCNVSFDRAYCDVYYTSEPNRYTDVEAAFSAAKGHIRSLMAKRLDWKQAPELRFHLDETVDAAEKLEQFINAEKERQAAYGNTVE